jgi:hypothetical protein
MIGGGWDLGKRKIWFSSPGCSGNAAAKTATNTNLRGFKTKPSRFLKPRRFKAFLKPLEGLIFKTSNVFAAAL